MAQPKFSRRPKLTIDGTFSENDDSVTVLEDPSVDLWLDIDLLDSRPFLETLHVDLVVEMTDVTNDSVVLHLGHVLGGDDHLVAGSSDEDIDVGNDGLDLLDFVTLHAGLKSTDGINFRNENSRPTTCQSSSATLSNISVTEDHDLLASQHYVGGAVESVGEGVLATIDVIEL